MSEVKMNVFNQQEEHYINVTVKLQNMFIFK